MQDALFTVWNVFFQTTYAAFSLYCDLRSLSDQRDEKRDTLMKVRKTIFSGLMWPAGCFVFTAFWSLFLIDRSLVFPEFIDMAVSKGNNFVIHVAVIPVILWELMFLPVEKPTSHKKYLAIPTFVYTCYMAWMIYIRSVRKLWPYPILKMLEGTIFLPLFLLGTLLLITSLYYPQWWLRQHLVKKGSIKSS